MFCLIGYSYLPFIICTLGCMAPWEIAQGLLILYALLSSTYLIIKNIHTYTEQEIDHKQRYTINGLVIGFQVIFTIIYKFYFFKLIN